MSHPHATIIIFCTVGCFCELLCELLFERECRRSNRENNFWGLNYHVLDYALLSQSHDIEKYLAPLHK
jgi:hypothetical protein